MEIRTTRTAASEQGGATSEPESNRYLRRRVPQKVRKSHRLGRLFLQSVRIGLKLGALAVAIALVAAAVHWALRSESFALRAVTVRGCRQADPRVIEGIIRGSFQGNLLTMDLPEVRRKVEAQTWVRSATVRRILPSEIAVNVEERIPSVILELKGELMIADREGILLDRYDEKQGRLDTPVFCGMAGAGVAGYRARQEENSNRVRLGLRVLGELEAGSADYVRNISEIDLSDMQNVRLLLVNDTAEILLGDRDFLGRFQKLMNNMAQYREVKERFIEIAWVDLRYDTQIVYMPRKESAEQASPGVVPLH